MSSRTVLARHFLVLIGSVISKEKVMDMIDLPLKQIIPYARNPRNNAEAVATVAASIRSFDGGHHNPDCVPSHHELRL